MLYVREKKQSGLRLLGLRNLMGLTQKNYYARIVIIICDIPTITVTFKGHSTQKDKGDDAIHWLSQKRICGLRRHQKLFLNIN